LARSLPDLTQEDEAGSAASLSDEGTPADHDCAEAPSFRPLSCRPADSPETSEKASLWKERSDVLAIATPDPRALARSSIGAGAAAKRVDRTPDEGRLNRVPRFVGPSQRILLFCCLFLTGFAAGLSASRVISFQRVISIQDVRTALSSVPKALGLSGQREVPFLADASALSDEPARTNELPAPTEPRASSLPPAALSDSPRGTVSGLSSDANRAPSSTDNPKVSSELSALEEQLERQFAEGRLNQPGNALDTYRKMAAIAPDDPATIALGGHLSTAVWSLADRARKGARWDDAVHYYAILKMLPPVPLAAILSNQSPEPSATERDAPAGAGTPVSTLPETAALPSPVISSETAELTKPPEAAPATSVVTSVPAGARSLGQAATLAVAEPSGRAAEPSNPRDVANAVPIFSSPPNATLPLMETAPMASIAAPTPAVGSRSPAASSGPPGNQAPDQSASTEPVISQDVSNAGPFAAPMPSIGARGAAASSAPVSNQSHTSSDAAASRDVANAGSVPAPTPAVGTNEASASPGPVREQSPGHGTVNGAAASQNVANAGPIVFSPSNAAALSPAGPSAIIGIAMSRGDGALAAGDVFSARQFYELAASNGLAHAATAVGRTYDPNFLQGKGVRGAFADDEAAKRWYQRAIDGGDAEARTRLDKLLKVDQGKSAR
jgi:hypothetical protein